MTREELENEAECAMMQREHLQHLRKLVMAANLSLDILNAMRVDPDLKSANLYQGPMIARQVDTLKDALAYYRNLR